MESGACCRLAGASLVVPAVNYWWPLPDDVRRSAYGKLDARDRTTFWIAHHAPSLLCAWLTQTWLPTSPIVRGERGAFTDKDWEILTELWRKQRESGQQVDRVQIHPILLQILPVLTWREEITCFFLLRPKRRGRGRTSRCAAT